MTQYGAIMFLTTDADALLLLQVGISMIKLLTFQARTNGTYNHAISTLPTTNVSRVRLWVEVEKVLNQK